MEISNETIFEKVIEATVKSTKAETSTERLFQIAASIKQDLNRVGDKVIAEIAVENKKMLTETELLILKAIAANNNAVDEKELKPLKRMVGLIVVALVLVGGDRVVGLLF